MDNRRNYGDAIARSFGLNGAPSLVARPLQSSRIAISRLCIGAGQMGMSARIPAEDSFVLAMYQTDVPHHELWAGGRRVIAQGYQAHSIRIVNLESEFSALVSHPHESLVFYIPRAALDAFSFEQGARRVDDLRCLPGARDPVLEGLAAALRPAIERPADTDPLFVDYVSLAALAHLSRVYGGDARRFSSGGLSPAQLRRALEFMSARHADRITLADAAEACGLSRGHFAQGFRRATGTTPHQWLQRYRLERVQQLLIASDGAIAEIAVACGFTDQSHLTRVFAKLTRQTPAAWRRSRRT
ncbi:MAG: AraC family transcriptional regulator [Rhizomicrobium sp.]